MPSPGARSGRAQRERVTARIRVQSVLYETPPLAIERFSKGLSQATRNARELLGVQIDLALGDCSSSRVMSDGDLDLLRRRFQAAGGGDLSYQFFDENLGHGGGQNRLLKGTSGDFVLIVNPDTCLGPSSIAALASAMREEVGIAEARQIPLQHPKAYDLATKETGWASGTCSLVRAAVFDAVGGFDDATFFMYCDDVDLSWRARLAGFRIVAEPSAVVFHDKSLAVAGTYVPSETEYRSSALASLLLPAKYSRPDVVAHRRAVLATSAAPYSQAAVEEYLELEARGRLPEPIDADRRVADFSTDAYAPTLYPLVR